VTGGGTGIGEAIAHAFAREGARVLIAGMPSALVEQVAADLRATGADAAAFTGDLSDEQASSAAVLRAVELWGGLDVLVNNASIFGAAGPLETFPVDAFDDVFRMNVRSAFLMTKAALSVLQARRGVILFSGSGVGVKGGPMVAPYAATKAAFHSLAVSLAAEQARHGVRVNAVAIGVTETAWNTAETGGAPPDPQRPSLPTNRLGTPREVAEVFTFLASDRASYVTGAVWAVDGGFLVAHGAAGSDVPDTIARRPDWAEPLPHAFDGIRDWWWRPDGRPPEADR
jgi:NAD(P)-dependent dehydrogenase (short-subunit alcohol dehydrogenase family)